MKATFDPQLVEETVHLLGRADRARWRTYRRRIDPLYDAPDKDRRIPEALLALFHEWGAATLCEDAIGPVEGADTALVARSRRPGDEGADLLVGAEKTLLVRLAPERFLEPDGLRCLLRHELRHIADILDPAFGYATHFGLRGRTRAERELVRGRYRVLWDLAIDVVETPPVDAATRRAQLDRAFASLEEEHRERLAERFRDPSLRKHESLAAAARDPWAFLGVARRAGPVAGQPCPLCAFPTHDWGKDPPADAIRSDFPGWDETQGACRQCCDIYRAAGSVS